MKPWKLRLGVFLGLFLSLALGSAIHIELGADHATVMDESGQPVGTRPIPTTMDEAMEELDGAISEEQKREILKTFRSAPHEMHFGLGIRLRNGWGLWSGSALARRLAWAGIRHPDNMSSFLIEEYVSHLDGNGSSDLILGRGMILLVLSAFGTLVFSVIYWSALATRWLWRKACAKFTSPSGPTPR